MKNEQVNMEMLLLGPIGEYLQQLGGNSEEVTRLQLQKTRKEFEGDITLVVFPLVKLTRKSPEQTGELIGNYLKDHVTEVRDFNVIKGFLNISFHESFWLQSFRTMAGNPQWGFSEPGIHPRVIVEYSSPNTNKPLHLGHLRNIFLGYSVSCILEALGHKITRVQIINDRGIHICKSMVAWLNYGHGETPESAHMKGDKFVGKYYVEFDKQLKAEQQQLAMEGMPYDEAANATNMMMEAQDLLQRWEAGDRDVIEVWKKMNGWVYEGFEQSYKRMGVKFDKLYYESDTYLLGKKEVIRGLEKGVFYKKEDGSVWVDLTAEGLDEKALLRKDGTTMYITQDIGTAILRFNDFPDTSYQIYTVGNEQEYHFKVLFAILKKLGFPQAEKCYHLSYGMVELPEGKMKSREGTVVDADDIMAEMSQVSREVAAEQGKLEGLSDDEKENLYEIIGMGALKYFLLRVDPQKGMMFNPKESIDFNGNTGPFIQYTYVRTRAVLRKAEEQSLTISDKPEHPGNLAKPELDVIRRIYEWPEVLKEAGTTYNPSLIAHFCHDLARVYNAFYHEMPILREEDIQKRNFRIILTRSTGNVLKNAMGVLGIPMPDRM